MLAAKLERSGQKLQLLSDDDAFNAVADLCSEIKLITGAIMHEGKMLEPQLEMLRRFIVTGFGNLTKPEIVQAFYMNLQGKFEDVFVHYNKELNAEFIGNVLRAYLRWKARLVQDKGHKIQLLLKAEKLVRRDIDYDFWKDLIQQDFEFYKKFRASDQIWHDRKYYTLRKFGLLYFKSLDTWFWFMKKAIKNTNGVLKVPVNSNMAKYSFVTVASVVNIFHSHEDFKVCLSEARRLAYLYVLKCCLEGGINNLWEDIKPV